MRILFVTATRIGDAVLSTRLADHLLHAHPEARVTVACDPMTAGVSQRIPRREATLGLFGPTPASEYASRGRRAAAVLAAGEPGWAPTEALPVVAALAVMEGLLAA